MKKILKRLSLALLGLAMTFSSCERGDYPFPEAERLTIIDLRRIDDGAAFLTSVSSGTTSFTFALKRFEYGGDYAIERVEFRVAVIDRDGVGQEAILQTFPGRVFFTDNELHFPTHIVSVTLQEVFDATGTSNADWDGGETVLFFYRIYMENGARFVGWSNATGDITRNPGGAPQGVFAMLRDEYDRTVAGSAPIPVICGVNFEDLLGEWRYTTTWGNAAFFGTGGILEAVEDPENPGRGLIMTMIPGSQAFPANEYWNQPVRLTICLETYTWQWQRQPVMIPWAAWAGGATGIEIWAGSGSFDGCLAPEFTITWMAHITNPANSGFANLTHTLRKIVP